MTLEVAIETSTRPSNEIQLEHTTVDEKQGNRHLEHAESYPENLHYDNEDEEPELHMRTYVALAAFISLQVTITLAVQGPPVAVSCPYPFAYTLIPKHSLKTLQLSFIGNTLHNSASVSWASNASVVALAVLGPIISSASDTFQARKLLLVGCCVVAFVGAAIAPGSQSLGRLIAAQTLVGVSLALYPISYIVPSEIVPRR